MAKLKKGSRLACAPCGREVIVDCCGVSEATIYCCGSPMKKGKVKAAKKASGKKKS